MFGEVFAHEGEEELPIEAATSRPLEEQLHELSFAWLTIATFIALFFILISIVWKEKTEKGKWILYLGIAIPIVLATLILAGTTVYLNLVSISGGPVHWHADFQVWACGKQLDLIDPVGIENRVGTSAFHEHGDNRIHIEGVVNQLEDVSLGKFFEAVGGELHADHLTLPTDAGEITYKNGDFCPDGTVGELQVFAWKTVPSKQEFFQEKLIDPADYVISPYATIPPGDCLIIEFGEEKAQTDRICDFYKIAEQKGELKRK